LNFESGSGQNTPIHRLLYRSASKVELGVFVYNSRKYCINLRQRSHLWLHECLTFSTTAAYRLTVHGHFFTSSTQQFLNRSRRTHKYSIHQLRSFFYYDSQPSLIVTITLRKNKAILAEITRGA